MIGKVRTRVHKSRGQEASSGRLTLSRITGKITGKNYNKLIIGFVDSRLWSGQVLLLYDTIVPLFSFYATMTTESKLKVSIERYLSASTFTAILLARYLHRSPYEVISLTLLMERLNSLILLYFFSRSGPCLSSIYLSLWFWLFLHPIFSQGKIACQHVLRYTKHLGAFSWAFGWQIRRRAHSCLYHYNL